jgi:hypothetical protein
MDAYQPATRSSRRSYPNLHNLSLAPLSAPPLDASAPPSPDQDRTSTRAPRTSYIAHKSAPTTPGILSLSQGRSASRNGRHAHYAYNEYFPTHNNPVRDAGDIPKAKSTSTLQPGVSFATDATTASPKGRHHARKHTAPLPLRAPLVRHHTTETHDAWFYRAGLAIAGETRDSKGQGWLIRRESSTSLVADDYPYDNPPQPMALLSGEHTSADAPPFFSFSPHASRNASRNVSRNPSRLPSRMTSRVPSARASRRGSRVGSRADLALTGMVPKSPSTARHSLDMADLDAALVEPDFVDGGAESDGDEIEVARLARARGDGFGGWMDALMGWSLFSVDEDGESESSSDDDDEESVLAGNEARLRREVEAKRRKLEREAIVAAAALSGAKEGDEEGEREGEVPRPAEEAGGWQDAAWLLSVASKALF